MDGLKLTERFPEAQVVKCTWNRRSFDCQLWLATKQTGYVSLKPLFQARERGNPFEITSRHVCKKKLPLQVIGRMLHEQEGAQLEEMSTCLFSVFLSQMLI
jgi:hypothetical protein